MWQYKLEMLLKLDVDFCSFTELLLFCSIFSNIAINKYMYSTINTAALPFSYCIIRIIILGLM